MEPRKGRERLCCIRSRVMVSVEVVEEVVERMEEVEEDVGGDALRAVDHERELMLL